MPFSSTTTDSQHLRSLPVQRRLFFGIYLLLLNRFQQIATNPLAQLIKQVETNRLSNAFSAKATVMEVDRFHYLLENRSLMVEKLEDRIDDIPKSGETFGLAKKQRSNLNARTYSNASSKVLTFIRGYPNFQ